MLNPIRKLLRDLLREWARRPVPHRHTDAHPVFKFVIHDNNEGECDVERLEAVAAVFTNLTFVILFSAELVARVICLITKPLTYVLSHYRRDHAQFRRPHAAQHNRRREDADDDSRLTGWLTSDGPPLFPRVSSFSYNSERDMWSQLRVNSFYTAHLHNSAALLRSDGDKPCTAEHVRKILRRINTRAKKSARFHKHFVRMTDFLDDLVSASPQALTRFLQRIAKQASGWPYIWMTEAAQRFAHSREHNAHAFEGGLAALALFFHEGAGPEMFYLCGWWLRSDRATSAALSTLMYFVIDRCGTSVTACNDTDAVSRPGLEQIFSIQEDEMQFRQLVSKFAKPSHKLYKDMLVWDFTLNNCNEFVEQAWSVEKMERAIWTLQYGRHYYSQRTYDMIVRQRNTRDLNLTFLKVRTLLSFSVSGIIRFTGYNACIYNVTGDDKAPIVVHGHLPLPTIEDLVVMGLATSIGNGRFRMNDAPGCKLHHKGVRTGERVLLVRSRRNVIFRAGLSQQVG